MLPTLLSAVLSWGLATASPSALRADGLRLQLAPAQATYCQGDSARVHFLVDFPARVRLYSVTADNTAIQVWPSQGQSGLLEPNRVQSFDVTMIADQDGPERLVAVAVPLDQSWPLLVNQRSCRVSDRWSPPPLPPGSQVASLSYEILSGRSCPRLTSRQARTVEILDRVLRSLPRCR